MAGRVVSSDAEVIRRAIESRVSDVYTALPGVVVSYDASTQAADVKLCVNRPLFTEEDATVHEPLPVIPNVPVLFPRGGGYTVTWPLVAGDACQILFQVWSFAQWRESDVAPSDPGDLRMHSLGNAVCIPGLASNKHPIDNTQAGANAYVVEGPEIRLGKDATEHIALAESLFDFIKNVISAGIPLANDGGAQLQTTMLNYITAHTSPNPFAATKAKAK